MEDESRYNVHKGISNEWVMTNEHFVKICFLGLGPVSVSILPDDYYDSF